MIRLKWVALLVLFLPLPYLCLQIPLCEFTTVYAQHINMQLFKTFLASLLLGVTLVQAALPPVKELKSTIENLSQKWSSVTLEAGQFSENATETVDHLRVGPSLQCRTF
jgi:hypothetical protein